MATRNKIGRLTERIEAVIERRRVRFALKDLTDEGKAKLRKLAAEDPVRDDPPDPVARAKDRAEMLQWSTDALLRFLIDDGALEAGDFKRRAGPHEDRTRSQCSSRSPSR
jgi:hypothetical protein